MIISVDFDNTLALGHGSIATRKPNKPLIDRLFRAHKEGAYIKVVTARGDRFGLTKKQKRKRYLNDIKDWLDQHNVCFRAISFKKEYAHIYIDDMTIGPHEDFVCNTTRFINNKVILTESTAVKSCTTAKMEYLWYEGAQSLKVNSPNVLFVNDELIITERIYGRKPTADEMIKVCEKFKGLPTFAANNPQTYIDNLVDQRLKGVKFDTLQTFFHGDLSTTNVIVKEWICYLIDPNCKGIFGNYLTDAAKAAWSFIAYEQDFKSAKKIVKHFKMDWMLVACEGDRVCKYAPQYRSFVNNIFDLCT